MTLPKHRCGSIWQFTGCGKGSYRHLARRFPPPWSIEELDACFVVIDSAGQKLAYVYFEDKPGRRCVEVAPSFQRRGLRVVDLRLMWRSCNSLLKSEFVRL